MTAAQRSQDVRERESRIVDMRRGGMTFRQIGAALGVTYGHAYQIYYRAERRGGERHVIKMHQRMDRRRVRDRAVLAARRGGLTWRQVALYFGFNDSRARQIYRRALAEESSA